MDDFDIPGPLADPQPKSFEDSQSDLQSLLIDEDTLIRAVERDQLAQDRLAAEEVPVDLFYKT